MSNQFNLHSSRYANNYTEQENQQFTAEFGAITDGFAAAMHESLAWDSDAVQKIVAEHYAFCSRFWTPTQGAYKSLAMSYILPSPYRDSYESHTPGLGQYIYNACVTWADNNL
ncbi:MAG: hypothetical protein RIR88_850 [Actinomycetota bacterium]|jgi:hypothetical protein